MKIDTQLKKLRKEKGYTQERLAEELGISRQAIAKWESGSSYPSTENLLALAQVLEVDVNELIVNENAVLLTRRVSMGKLELYKNMLVHTWRGAIAGYELQDRYQLSLMSNISVDIGVLAFRYGKKTVQIALQEDTTDWEQILDNAVKGIYPEAESTESVEEYIVAHYAQKDLIDAVKYYLDMKGGSKKQAIEIVKNLLDA